MVTVGWNIWKISKSREGQIFGISFLGESAHYSIDYASGGTYNIPSAISYDDNGNSVSVTQTGNVTKTALGDYVITYTATQGGTTVTAYRTVVTADTESPIITIKYPDLNPQTIFASADQYSHLGVIVNDNYDTDDNIEIINTGINISFIGEYSIGYTAKDTSGNYSNTVYRMVVVEDNTNPTIEVIGDSLLTISYSTENYNDQGATVSDIGDQDISLTTTGQMVNRGALGTYIVEYTASDSSGNAANQYIEQL